MTVALITAVYDGYDSLKALPPLDDAPIAICVTDDPELRADGWTIVCEQRPGAHPNLAAKRPKCTPWKYTDADVVVWIDASFRVTSPASVTALAEYEPLAQFIHPDRDCIYHEANYSAGMGKYAELPLAAQTDHYRTLEHPDGWGLWATGVIVRKRTRAIEAFGEAWLGECQRWSFQDQVSEAPMLREFGLRPAQLPGTHFANPWLRYEGSGRH